MVNLPSITSPCPTPSSELGLCTGRVIYEVAAIFCMAPYFLHFTPRHPVKPPGQADCHKWDWSRVCAPWRIQKIPILIIAYTTILYFLLYLYYMLRCFWQLKQRPFNQVRLARMLISLQVGATPS